MSLKDKIKIGIKFGWIAIGTSVAISVLFMILSNLGLSEPSKVIEPEDFKLPVLLFFVMVIIAPAIEEFIFRFIPIKLTKRFTENKYILWAVIILSSSIFGLGHGSWHHLFIQGSAGIILSLAFLRGGYISSFVSHVFINFMVFLLIFINL